MINDSLYRPLENSKAAAAWYCGLLGTMMFGVNAFFWLKSDKEF